MKFFDKIKIADKVFDVTACFSLKEALKVIKTEVPEADKFVFEKMHNGDGTVTYTALISEQNGKDTGKD